MRALMPVMSDICLPMSSSQYPPRLLALMFRDVNAPLVRDGGMASTTSQGGNSKHVSAVSMSSGVQGEAKCPRPPLPPRHEIIVRERGAPLTTSEGASQLCARHLAPAPAWRDPGSSGSHARTAPTVSSPRSSRPVNPRAGTPGGVVTEETDPGELLRGKQATRQT